MNLWQRIQSMFGKKRFERELDDELRFHLDAQIQANLRAGMSPPEARRQAMLELGGMEQVKERVRVARPGFWLETLWQDVRFGARMVRKNPGFTAVAVLTLALGIGANTAIFTVVNAVLLRPLPYPDSDQLVFIQQTSLKPHLLVGGRQVPPPPGGEPIPVSPPNFVDFREMSRSFAHMGAFATLSHTFTTGEPERLPTAMITSGLLEALAVRPEMGRIFTAEDQQGAGDVVILSHALWQRKFGGDSGVLGRTIPISGQPHTVIGVMPPEFQFPADVEAWLPLVFGPHEMEERNSGYLEVVARLAPGVSLSQARADLSGVAHRLGETYPESNRDFGVRVVPLHAEIVGPVRAALLVLLGAVGFVLLIACANVAHLLLARSASRERELAVRSALGAGRARLVRQLFVESALLGLLGGALGLLLALWGMAAMRGWIPEDVPRLAEIQLDGRVLIFALAASLMAAVFFGVVPALRASQLDLHAALKEGARGSGGRSHRRLRQMLVVGEIALSLVLLAGAGLMLNTMWGMMTTDPGFDSLHILTAETLLPRAGYSEARQTAFLESVLDGLQALPGVEGAAATTNLPLAGSNFTYAFLMEGQPEVDATGAPRFANFRVVSPDFHRVLRIPLRRGRLLTDADAADAPDVVLINEAMARKYWPGQEPIGRRIRIARGSQPAWRTIVGVVGNIRHTALYQAPQPEMYVPFAQQPMRFIRLAVRTTQDPMSLAPALRRVVRKVDPEQPVTRVRSMADVISGSMADTRFHGLLLSAFAALALVLAAVGIYGTLAYTVAERTHEIGIRVALGAHPGDVFGLVIGQGLRLVLIGAALGLTGAAFLTRLIKDQLHGVQPTDPGTFAAVTLVLALVAVVACYIPARRATRVDPMVALRYE